MISCLLELKMADQAEEVYNILETVLVSTNTRSIPNRLSLRILR
jgi:hypothetical protein